MKSQNTFLFVAPLLGTLLFSGCGPTDSDPTNPAPSPPPEEGQGGTEDGQANAEDSKPARIAFVTNGVDPFWKLAQRGVETAGADLGVDVSVHMPAGSSDQKRMLEDLVTSGVDGIAVSPMDAKNQTEFLNKVAQHTKLVTHDSDAPDSERLVYIGMDNYKAGRMCGELVKEVMPNGGTIMIFIGRMDQDNAEGRRQGLIDELLGRDYNPKNDDPPGKVLSGGGFEILGTLTDGFDRAKGKANVENTLSRYPDIQGMVGMFAFNPPLILEALEQAGKLGQVKVVGFDEDDQTLQGITDGTIHGTVVQNPYMYGYRSVEVLQQVVNGNTSMIPENQFINIPARHIRKDNVEAFWAEKKKQLGENGRSE